MSIMIYTANRDTYAALTEALISKEVIRLLLSVVTATTTVAYLKSFIPAHKSTAVNIVLPL